MNDQWMELIAKVKDEPSFIQFLRALREDLEATERDCSPYPHACFEAGHWESRSTRDFLRSAEEWAGGDFADGRHYGDPILRRVATMLYVARYRVRE